MLDNKENINFIHFGSESICDQFVEFANKNNIITYRKCCGGVGVGCEILDNDELDKIKKKFELIYYTLDEPLECIICYELTNIITICRHCLCNKCYEKITLKICPYCRKNI